jgi:hypothetical protein
MSTHRQLNTLLRKGVLILSLLSIFMGMVTGCASTTEIDDTVVFDIIKEPSPYKIAIVNASNNTINDIKYKPCNSHDTRYQQLTGHLRPKEKFSINIYSQCVDLLATNAFKKKLVDAKNVDLKSVKTWTIK